MLLARCFAVALAVMVLACAGTKPATFDEAVTRLHPFDPTAPIAYRVWPMEFLGCVSDGPPSFGVTMHLWRDRAVLTLDDEPLHAQWKRGVRRNLRVSRWTMTSEQCNEIPSLYDEGLAVVPVRDEQYDNLRLGVSAIFEFVVDGRKVPPDEVASFGSWLGRVWETLHTCAKTGKTT